MKNIIFKPDKKMSLIKSEKSFKDWNFSKIVKVDNNDFMENTYDYTDWIPYIDNQFDTGFCWAFSTSLMQASYEFLETNRKIKLSPYYLAKKGKEKDGLWDTEGSTILNSVQTLCEIGTISDDLYDRSKYIVGSLQFPEIENEDKIRHYKSCNYARLNSLEDIVLALSQKKLPLLGIQCTKDIYNLKNGASKFLEFDPNGKMIIIGGHQMVVCGWFPQLEHNGHKGYLKCANSWGTTYGENGFLYIPRDYIEFQTKDIGFSLFMDAFATIDLKNDNIKENNIELTVGKSEAYINDKEYKLEAIPTIKDDRTFVPVRFIAEAFGATVKWSEVSKKVTIKLNDSTIHLYINKDYALINGKKYNLDTYPYIENNRCMVPIRFIAEALNFVVLWHGSKTQKITILE